MDHEVWVIETDEGVAATAAEFVARAARDAVVERGRFTMAVSGGRTPWVMFGHLAHDDVPWEQVHIWQVDERIAPADDPDRNLLHLRDALGDSPAVVHPMPVEDDDVEAACAAYAADLPERFDLIHLGLGPDGHTASLVPDDAVLGVTDRLVAPTGGTYQGRHRMTLTYPALERTDQLLWLVTGDEKRGALAGMLAGDPSEPASAVHAARSLIITDRAAHPQDP